MRLSFRRKSGFPRCDGQGDPQSYHALEPIDANTGETIENVQSCSIEDCYQSKGYAVLTVSVVLRHKPGDWNGDGALPIYLETQPPDNASGIR